MSHSRHHSHCAGAARGTFALPGTARKYERSLEFRFHHLALDLRILVASGRVRGHATLTLERVSIDARELHLDAVDFDVKKLEVDTGRGFKPVSFDYDDEALCIRLDKRFQRGRVRVHYEAAPKRGLYFLKPDDQVKDRPVQVWSQCEDEDARHWFPCHDKPHVKTSAEFRYTVPSGMQVLANGERVDARPAKPTKSDEGERWSSFRFQIEEPLPSYLVTLVVGDFDVVEDRPAKLPSGREVPVSYWLPKGKRADGLRAFARTPHMIEHFSRVLGVEYPFSRYSQIVVSDFIFGGMENTTATTMYEHVLLDERAAIDVDSHDLVAHELAHQWFGDWVTCRDWPEAWLNEGFATYFEHIEREDRLGFDEYLHGLERDLDTYLSEASSRYRRPIVCREYDEPIDLFDRHLYEKGSLVLHLLRRELSDSTFFAAIRRYIEARGRATATTHDLKGAFEAESGRSFDRFFDEWVHRAGHPELKAKITYANQLLTLELHQTQKTPPYQLVIEVEILPKHGAVETRTMTLDGRHGAVTVSLAERPQYVAIDPNLRVLGELNVEAPSEMLRAQLLKAKSVRARHLAAKALAKKHDFKSTAALSKVLANEREPWMVRVGAAAALGKLRNDATRDALLAATRTKEPRVRAAVAEALGSFDDERTAKALMAMLKSEKSYLVTAQATLALGKTRAEFAGKQLERQLREKSWADVVASAALDGLAELRDPSRAEIVKRYAAYGQPARARRNAVIALAKLAKTDATGHELEKLLRDAHPHFRISVVAALEELGDRNARAILNRHLGRETDARVLRKIREVLHRMRQNQASREVADKVTRMEKEVEELRARLATLEAKAKAG